MNEISPIAQPLATALHPTDHLTKVGATVASSGPIGDRVELSPAATYVAKLRQLPAVRQDLINNVRTQIAAGTYESSAKIDAAIENMAEDLHE